MILNLITWKTDILKALHRSESACYLPLVTDRWSRQENQKNMFKESVKQRVIEIKIMHVNVCISISICSTAPTLVLYIKITLFTSTSNNSICEFLLMQSSGKCCSLIDQLVILCSKRFTPCSPFTGCHEVDNSYLSTSWQFYVLNWKK